MEYPDIDVCFVCRINSFVQEYNGDKDATMLLNCMLGMLIVPYENSKVKLKKSKHYKGFVVMMVEELINSGDYRDLSYYRNYYYFINGLRNSIAHFNVKQISNSQSITGFNFKGYATETEKIEDTAEYTVQKTYKSKNLNYDVNLNLSQLKKISECIKNTVVKCVDPENCRYRSESHA